MYAETTGMYNNKNYGIGDGDIILLYSMHVLYRGLLYIWPLHFECEYLYVHPVSQTIQSNHTTLVL